MLQGKVMHGLGSGAQPLDPSLLNSITELLILRQEPIAWVDCSGTILLGNLTKQQQQVMGRGSATAWVGAYGHQHMVKDLLARGAI
jgi:hypothetical protein